MAFGPRFFLDQYREGHAYEPGMPIVWRVSGYAVIPGPGRTILTIIPKWGDLYELPGGGVEPEEGMVPGIEREVAEETGYSCRIISSEPFAIQEEDFYFKAKEQFCRALIHIYPGKLRSDVQDVTKIDASEIREAVWVPIRDLDISNVHEIFWNVVHKLQSGAIPWPEPQHVF